MIKSPLRQNFATRWASWSINTTRRLKPVIPRLCDGSAAMQLMRHLDADKQPRSPHRRRRHAGTCPRAESSCRPRRDALCIVHFDDLIESVRHVPAMLEHKPSAIELLDEIIVSESMTNPATRAYADFYEGTPNCVQVVELMADTPGEASQLCHAFAEDMHRRGIGTAHVIRDEPSTSPSLGAS